MTVQVTSTGKGLAAALNDGQAAPLAWVDGWTFRLGGQLIIFERGTGSGAAQVMRIDSGGGHYVLTRK